MLKKVSILFKVYFPEDNIKSLKNNLFLSAFNLAYERIEYCFKMINVKYYNNNKNFYFNHLNADHMCTFFYFLSNSLYREGVNEKVAQKLFYLNKILHSVDIFYKVKLPNIFLLVHPLGTVIGRAKFDNYAVIYQNVTIGGVREKNILKYPEFGKGVILYSGSSIVGNCKIGNNVTFAANTKIVNKNISNNKLVLGIYPNNRVVKNEKNNSKIFFK
jgi:serine O-acetyltransferase